MGLILLNGNVITMAPTLPRAQALGIEDGRIASVGDSQCVLESRTARTHVVDLEGRTVLPGFVDAHVHAFLTGLCQRWVDLTDAGSVAAVCRKVARRAADVQDGDWVFAFQCAPWSMKEKRYPSAGELDVAAPRNPVYVCSATFHSGAANSRGEAIIREACERRGWQTPPSGTANSSHFLKDEHHFAATRIALGSLSNREIEAIYREVSCAASRKGVTMLHCLEGQFVEEDRDVDVLLGIRDDLSVEAILFYQTFDVQRVQSLGLPRIGGCLAVDGACSEHTACFYEPYFDDPTTRGFLNYSEATIESFVLEAHAAGLQIAMHAIGDRAIDVLVAAYRTANCVAPTMSRRHRIEHCTAPTDGAKDQIRSLGLCLSLQPYYCFGWDQPGSSMYERCFGPSRARRMEPVRWATDSGVPAAGGSDSPVTEIDPLLGIHSAVNDPRVDRRLSVAEALRLFTVGGAEAVFAEAETGTLEAGKSADVVVVDRDPFREPRAIRDFAVDVTLRAGQPTYDRCGLL